MPSTLTTHDALQIALASLLGSPVSDADRQRAAARLHEILRQRGLEDLEPACDGTLPDFIDVVIDG